MLAQRPFSVRHLAGRRVTAVACLALLLSGCLSTRLPPISSAGAAFQPLPDEVQLWNDASAEEDQLLAEAYYYDDPLLEDYLQQIVDRLTTPGMRANPEIGYQVAVLEDPTLNAFAYPHGSLYLHTGLLARMQNEAQLAMVLAHEMSHVERRHMVRYRRSMHNRQIGLTAAAVAAWVIIAHEQGEAWDEGKWGKAARIGALGHLLVSLGLELAFIASVNGYGRHLETEADFAAFENLERAGYEPRQASAVFELLQQGSGGSGDLEVFFFSSHPQLSQRIENAEQWNAERQPQADQGAEMPGASSETGVASETAGSEPNRLFPLGEDLFWQRILPVIRDDARLNLDYGRLSLAAEQLAKVMDAMPQDPEVHYLFARLRRAQAETDAEARDRLLDEAKLALREAIRLQPEHAEAHRDLGLLAYDSDDYTTACLAFYHYATLAPEAEDAAEIDRYFQDLKADGLCR